MEDGNRWCLGSNVCFRALCGHPQSFLPTSNPAFALITAPESLPSNTQFGGRSKLTVSESCHDAFSPFMSTRLGKRLALTSFDDQTFELG